jgi:flavorubredoxin
MKMLVLYYSRTGNTEKMAKAVAEGAKASGNIEVDLSYFVEANDLAGFDALVVGVPTYHHDMPVDVKNLFEQAVSQNVTLKGKPAATFGSFGWSGEAPKLVLEIMKQKFEMNIVDEQPLLAKYVPDEATLEQCRGLGKRVSESLIRKA